jgi:hypothetical protein
MFMTAYLLAGATCVMTFALISIMGKSGTPKRYKMGKAIAELSLADVEESQFADLDRLSGIGSDAETD